MNIDEVYVKRKTAHNANYVYGRRVDDIKYG